MGEIPVHVDFPEGTAVQDAVSRKKQLIELNATAEAAAQGNVVVNGRGRSYKRETIHSKDRHLQNLKQSYIGQFELRIDETDLKWLRG